MASSSARSLRLLSLLNARRQWDSAALAGRLDISRRTLRRDIDELRELGYPIEATRGSGGGYRLGADARLPPIVLDSDQALAAVVALQSAPTTILGLEDASRQALATVREAMPERLRAEADALRLTAVPNYWEFAAPPIDGAVLRTVGSAVRSRHMLRIRYRRHPAVAALDDPSEGAAFRMEPHHLVLWGGRWYVVVFLPEAEEWRVLRVDRIEPAGDSWREFPPRTPPMEDIGELVMSTADRGDSLAEWPCIGSVVFELPAGSVARFAPSGSVVEEVGPGRSRLRLGAWSWAGVAGLIATFGADFAEVEPKELRERFTRLAEQIRGIAD